MGKKHFYVVVKGRQPGIYTSWYEAEKQVNGFPGAQHRGFGTRGEAQHYFRVNGGPEQGLFKRVKRKHQPSAPQPPSFSAPVPYDPARFLQGQAGSPPVPACTHPVSTLFSPKRHFSEFQSASLRGCYPSDRGGGGPSPAFNHPSPHSRTFSASQPLSPSSTEPIGSGAKPGISGKGCDLMKKMGYEEGGGLGLNGQGIKQPVRATSRPQGKDGLGADPESHAPLHPSQEEVLQLCLSGQNVFFTGVGGTGKSFTLNRVIKRLQIKFRDKDAVAVAAPTGVAAINVGGTTLHSVAGCGVPNTVGHFGRMWAELIRRRWRHMKVLIIDEVSMLDAAFLEWMDIFVREIRGKPNEAFGGIQLVFCGDFCQLPPVAGQTSIRHRCPISGSDRRWENIPVQLQDCCGFAFQTACWREANFHYAELKHVFRQSEVPFVDALSKLRLGITDPETHRFFSQLNRPLNEGGKIKATVLYPKNESVDAENRMQLSRLPGEARNFQAHDWVIVHPEAGPAAEGRLWQDKFFENCPTPKSLDLKIGAQVMLTKNLFCSGPVDSRLVNGSRGVVVGFASHSEVKQSKQQELQAAVDSAVMESLKEELRVLSQDEGGVGYPIVEFKNGRTHVCTPVEIVNDIYITGCCVRTQVPLKLAWAVTMHKCQGATLDLVKVDLHGCFELGQAYVALSRARDSEGLQVLNFHPRVVKSDRSACGFHQALSKGTVDKFLETVSMWWAPLLREDAREWRSLFQTSSYFQKWQNRYGSVGVPAWTTKR